MKVKVCGITSMEQLQQLERMGADYAGLIFYEGSKRYPRQLEEVQEQVRNTRIKKVGVFVNADFEFVRRKIDAFGLQAVQLHGDETDEFCLELMDLVEVIKVFRIGDEQNIDELVQPYKNVCNYFLFDTNTAGYGGSGRTFNWQVLTGAAIGKSFFLSGGIGPDDVKKIWLFDHPCLYAVDINSRFEVQPGLKDMDMVASFIKTMQNEESKSE